MAETTPRPLTDAITLVEVPPREKARIAIVLGFDPSLMKLAAACRLELGAGRTLRVAEVLPLVRVRQDPQHVAGTAAPADADAHERLLHQLLRPAADGRGGRPSPDRSTGRSSRRPPRSGRCTNCVLRPTPIPRACMPTHLRLHLAPATFWKAFTSSWLWNCSSPPGSAPPGRRRRPRGPRRRRSGLSAWFAWPGVSVAVRASGVCKNTCNPVGAVAQCERSAIYRATYH